MTEDRADSVRVAQVRVCPVKGDLAANASSLMAALDRISTHRPDVVVTPECFLDGYVATKKCVTAQTLAQYAIDPARSEYGASIAGWARANRSWVVFGCCRLSDKGVHNSAVIYDRDGMITGMYDKVHCQTHDRKFLSGGSLPVYQSDFGRFGVMICADRRWPETVRTLALGGARVIFNPTYGMHNAANLRMMRTRSYESEVFIVFTHPGQSLVTGPRGEVILNERSREAAFSVCEIDLSEVERVRTSEKAHLRDRRPEVYRI